jgi:hypothetical protein
MFEGCSSLIELPTLPATSLAGECYCRMFDDCISLTTVPTNYLPVTSLEVGCYSGMFAGCTSLTNAPELPATIVKAFCYEFMFQGCTSLTTAPVLPARHICYQRCYAQMFDRCSNLNYVKCLAENGYVCDSDVWGWLDGVSRIGTFVKLSTTTEWEDEANGVPRTWAIVNA